MLAECLSAWSSSNPSDCPRLFDYLSPAIAIMTNPIRDELRENEGGLEPGTTLRFAGRRTRRIAYATRLSPVGHVEVVNRPAAGVENSRF